MEILNKEIAKELMKIKGEVRGFSLKSDAEFIVQRKGEDGLKKLEEEMARVGQPIKYKEIKPTNFYPIGLKALTLVAIKKVFNFKEKDFMELGKWGSKFSFIVRFWIGYMGSIALLAKAGPKMWRKYYTVGDIEIIVEYDRKKGYAREIIRNFNLHPLFCQMHKGYLISITRAMIKKEVTCEEIKCVHRGDEYHEFLVKVKE